MSSLGPTMENRGPGPFKEYLDGCPGPRWIVWKRDFELVMKANKIEENDRAVWVLVHGGPDIQRLDAFLPKSEIKLANGEEDGELVEAEKGEYDSLMERLDAYFLPKVLFVIQRAKFRELEQAPSERIDSFILRLREQGARCDYGDKLDIIIIDQLIEKCRSEKLKLKLREKDYTLSEVQALAAAFELQEGEASSKINRVEGTAKNKFMSVDTRTCFSCGRKGHISASDTCPARGKKCRKCGGFGHFEKQCRKRKNYDSEVQPSFKKLKTQKEVNLVDVEQKQEDIYDIFYTGISGADIDCVVGGVQLKMLIDSGADLNIIGYDQWLDLKQRKAKIWNPLAGDNGKVLKAYAADKPMEIVGSFMAKIEAGTKSGSAQFYVVKNGNRALLSRVTSQELGVLKLGCAINAVVGPFNKIKGFVVEFKINDEITPVVQPYRRIPAALEAKVNDKLKEMEEQDIIERVDCPSLWVSAMVVELKKNGDLRICIDMRLANKAILREVYPLPTIEEITARLGDSKYFSLLDISQAFHQVEISESSRHITTFITSKGLYRYKRLMFGISCAPEKFQKILESILSGCEGCLNFLDDILIFGKTKEDHDKKLKIVMERLKEYGVLLNQDKCKFGVTHLEFLGFCFSEKGINIPEEKLKAVKSLNIPKNVSELRSFLGYINFMKKFIPNMSTVTAPLNELLRSGKSYTWGENQSAAFKTLKSLLCNARTLGFYVNKDHTEIITDASPVGLGAVLLQKDHLGDYRIISYASRSLSDTERRYAQTEKEALAIVWSVEKFHYYLYGKRFFVVTDHRPLEVIFGERSRPCLRIERWVLRLASYDFEVMYRPGKTNIADPFSRMCENSREEHSFDEISENWISHVAEISRPKAIKMEELQKESQEDMLIYKIKKAVFSDKWGEDLKQIALMKHEFCFYGDLLLRGTRIVIPETLQQRTLQLAHSTHAGVDAMKQVLRTKVWWPGIDNMVKEFVKSCKECLLVSLPDPPEPLRRRELPSGPWDDVAVDFLGPLPTGEYLFIVVDYYSRYQEIEVMTTTTAVQTVHVLKKIFGRCGYPLTMTSDNGPQFVSGEMKNYCDEVGITLNTTTPYWPQQNGEVERQNRDVLKFMRCCHSSGGDWKKEIYDYILVKNTSVNSTTGKSPADLHFNRAIRNKIPALTRFYEGYDDDIRDKDREMKQRGKECADTRRHAKPSEIEPGHHVVVKNFSKNNKLDTNFSPEIYKVIERKGAEVKIQSLKGDKVFRRNIAHVKRFMASEKEKEEDEEISQENEEENGDGKLEEKENGSPDGQQLNIPISDAGTEVHIMENGKSPIKKLNLKRKSDNSWEVSDKSPGETRPKRTRVVPKRYR